MPTAAPIWSGSPSTLFRFTRKSLTVLSARLIVAVFIGIAFTLVRPASALSQFRFSAIEFSIASLRLAISISATVFLRNKNLGLNISEIRFTSAVCGEARLVFLPQVSCPNKSRSPVLVR